MKSLQDYIDIYREIANNLQLTGDSVELLVQMMANATYISEVEQVSFANEASLERATLMNSKIQHCVNLMYSVFRGKCPRVKLRFKCKKILSFNKHDVVYSSNRFSLYYDEEPKTFYPDSNEGKVHTIECILAAERIEDTQILPDYNRYYIDLVYNNLSNDVFVKVNGSETEVYRRFADHLRYGGLFDLTMPDFGMRLYAPDIFRQVPEIESYNGDEDLPPSNTTITTWVYRYCLLSDFNVTELSKINIKGTEFPEMIEGESYPGITLINEIPRDTVDQVHYKANRDRYVNSILRSNTDIGALLEEMYPDKVVKGGTFYDFVKLRTAEDEKVEKPDVEYDPDDPNSYTTRKGYILRLRIYYIPYNLNKLLTPSDINEFKKECTAYYVTENIEVQTGERVEISFRINVELYSNLSIQKEVDEILNHYENKFNMDLASKLPEIESAISKISNVKSFIRTSSSNGTITDYGIKFYKIDKNGLESEYKPSKVSYCVINSTITSKVIMSKNNY